MPNFFATDCTCTTSGNLSEKVRKLAINYGKGPFT